MMTPKIIFVWILLGLLTQGTSALPIAKGWRIHKGDDSAWSKPSFDDSDWNAIDVGQAWEKGGLPKYDGYAWYRLRLTIPGILEGKKNAQKHQKLLLKLGSIDDVDTTFFNGVKVGETGDPKRPGSSWAQKREYKIPLNLVHWDEENVIAVRVFDSDGDGGLCKGPYNLAAPDWHDFANIKIGLGRGDGIYPSSNSTKLTAVIENQSSEEITGTVSWQVHNESWRIANRGQALSAQDADLTLRPNHDTPVSHQFTPSAPGFYHVTCSFEGGAENKTLSQSMLIGFSPEKAKRLPDTPKDMGPFWDEAKAELATVKPQFKVSPSPKHSTSDVDCHLVEMRSLGDILIRGWLQVPKKDGPHPALLRVPGYRGNMQPITLINDMVVLSLNIRGHGNSQDDISGKDVEFLVAGADKPQEYFYRGAFMDCLRGLDFMESRSEVDAQRMGITGGSQGGMLSLATAALDSRIILCAPDIPFVIDSFRAFDTTEWPGSIFRNGFKQNLIDRSTARNVLRYFDPKNLAGQIKCPVFMGVGLQDPVTPAPTNFAAYNQITAPKDYRVYPFAGHGLPGKHYFEQLAWIQKQFAQKR
ncbi:MAG: acetylxylan esterase [Akkermansiaceae bacterium]|nr:acetylxylan esterase [Akkermansiaceae bacterium]